MEETNLNLIVLEEEKGRLIDTEAVAKHKGKLIKCPNALITNTKR